MTGRMTLILGGARSGKSSHAERLAQETSADVLYVATAEAKDEEMRTRIEAHRAQRPASWRTLETPRAVGQAIAQCEPAPEVVLLDCITLLANNVFGQEATEDQDARRMGENELAEEIDALLAAFEVSEAKWIVVSNEVGQGLVPAYPLGRAYRDALGRANIRLAQAADTVLYMVAGLAQTLKAPVD